MRPVVLQRKPLTADDVDRRAGARDRVEAGGEHDCVELERFARRVDSGLGNAHQRVTLQVHQPHMGQIERGMVVGVQAQPFGADRIAGGAQRVGRLRIVHGGANLAADEVGKVIVGRPIGHHVGVEVEHLQQFAALPGAFVSLLAFVGRHRERRDHRAFQRHPAEGVFGRLTVGRIVGQLGELVRGYRTVVGGDRKARRALENHQLRCLRGDEWDGLDARRPGADDADAFAGEVDGFVGPSAREIHLAGEVLDAVDVEILGHRKTARRHDEVATVDLVAAVGAHAVCGRVVVPMRMRDPGAELDVATKVVLVGDVVQVPQYLGLGGVLLRPLPVARPVRVEAEHVVDAGDVDACAGVAVPVPGAAHVVTLLENAHRMAREPETVRGVQTREAGADDHNIHIGAISISHVLIMATGAWCSRRNRKPGSRKAPDRDPGFCLAVTAAR